jgi:uncharacterized membrane protein YphA (DoxX/SURF4 family)
MQLSAHIVGRTLLASLFIVTALKSILFGFDGFVGMVKSKNIPFPVIVAILALATKLIGGLSVTFDWHSELGALMLIVFTTIATVLFHNAFADSSQLTNMLKNISIIGGLVLLIGFNLARRQSNHVTFLNVLRVSQ